MDIVFFAMSLTIGGYFIGNGLHILIVRRLVLKRTDTEPYTLTGHPVVRIGVLHISIGLIFTLVGLQIAGFIDLIPSSQGRSLIILMGLLLYAYNSIYTASLHKTT